MGCNSIIGGHINAKWSQQSIKLGVQHDTVSAVNIIFTDGRNCANLEYNAVIECDVTNIFQRTANCFRCKGQIFKSGVHIHGCAVVESDNGGYQHTAL